jgi:hypothetical protein
MFGNRQILLQSAESLAVGLSELLGLSDDCSDDELCVSLLDGDIFEFSEGPSDGDELSDSGKLMLIEYKMLQANICLTYLSVTE